MEKKGARREEVLERLEEKGGLREGVAAEVHRETGVPEADIYGVATFYHLLADPDAGVRVCQGLSCKLGDCDGLKAKLDAEGTKNVFTSCLGRCDMAPALWDPDDEPPLADCHLSPSSVDFAIDLAAPERGSYEALEIARERGGDWVVEELKRSGVTGRGGAGFPAHIKWGAIRQQEVTERYIVLNADEGEPGTFKDREVILKRPHLVAEGLAIAAHALEAGDIYCYVRGEFGRVKQALIAAVEEAKAEGWLDDSVRWHFVEGHGAYICGEETALLEALEGKRGMPRMKPPFPVEKGFRNKPTLIQNVETIACVPAILRRGGEWFESIGRTQPGSKLYCMSGHVERPGVYEAPMGVSMAELDRDGGWCSRRAQGFLAGRSFERLLAGQPGRHRYGLQEPRRSRLDARLNRASWSSTTPSTWSRPRSSRWSSSRTSRAANVPPVASGPRSSVRRLNATARREPAPCPTCRRSRGG